MSNAVHLSLLIGPIIPLPVPAMLIDGLEEVTVTSASEGASGFQLRFKVNSKSELNTLFLIAVGNNTSLGTPPLRVVLIVTLGGRPQPLFDGVLTNVEVQAGQNRQPGSITITGEDLTKVMDLIDFSGMPPGAPHVMDGKAKFEESSPEYRGSRPVVADIPSELRARLQEVALRSYRALRVRDYGRIDLRVTDSGDIYVIEVNANCYLERDSEFASAAAAAGIDYPTLIERIATLAVDRHHGSSVRMPRIG